MLRKEQNDLLSQTGPGTPMGQMFRSSWQPALLALDGLNGFEERFAKVRAAGDRLLDGVAKLDGYTVRRVENGTNIHFLEIAERRRQGRG